ncbi:hypothetical protein GCM10009792_19330 [Microcella alkalica]|uniref:DsrE/DsrF-like family protein n=1 Tax=Microcella alkalica TaxID=355930 RepID=A0A839EBY1_9MICO|nr:DsrE family protein [Microcella alkalica]MBA8848643.1 hypothetical protein [Microcella alkalica]
MTQLKIAILVLNNIEHDLARTYRALKTASEFVNAGDDVTIVFDGSGVDSLAAVSADDSKLKPLIESLRPHVRGACSFCAKAHGVVDPITAAGWPLLTDNEGEASVRQLALEGRQIITF